MNYLIHKNCPCKASPASYALSWWQSTIIPNDNHLMLLQVHMKMHSPGLSKNQFYTNQYLQGIEHVQPPLCSLQILLPQLLGQN